MNAKHGLEEKLNNMRTVIHKTNMQSEMINYVLFLGTQAVGLYEEPFIIADYIKAQFEKHDKSWLGQKDWIC